MSGVIQWGGLFYHVDPEMQVAQCQEVRHFGSAILQVEAVITLLTSAKLVLFFHQI